MILPPTQNLGAGAATAYNSSKSLETLFICFFLENVVISVKQVYQDLLQFPEIVFQTQFYEEYIYGTFLFTGIPNPPQKCPLSTSSSFKNKV